MFSFSAYLKWLSGLYYVFWGSIVVCTVNIKILFITVDITSHTILYCKVQQYFTLLYRFQYYYSLASCSPVSTDFCTPLFCF